MAIYYILFNPKTKEFVSYTNSSIKDKTNLLVKEISTDEEDINVARWRVDGNADNFKLVDLWEEKKAVVTEDDINKKYYNLLFRKYKIDEIIFAWLAGDDDKMQDIHFFAEKLHEKKKDEIAFFKNSKNHIFEDNKFQEDRQNKIFKV